jgi:UDP-2,4-diacetamido-2,4,6-trideoxy-beta-L-altropyranose hydrolase
LSKIVRYHMSIIFRTDSSIKIGTGHLMRCLTLADKFREQGNVVHFICRNLKGNLGSLAVEKGYPVHYLAAPTIEYALRPDDCRHAKWLEIGWEEDARQTLAIIEEYDLRPELFIIDHYALDYRFERMLKSQVEYIAVIDDLADRKHDCNMILDQNLQSEMKSRYDALVPANCQKLLGPHYALIRPEFREERELQTERNGRVRKILVFFGGIDKDNVTSMALNALAQMNLKKIDIDVVIGRNNPHQLQISEICQKMPNVRLHCQTDNFAHLMSRADLALCASGTTTWERCALGLPSLVVAVAENQIAIAEAADRAGLLVYLGTVPEVNAAKIINAINEMMSKPGLLKEMSRRGSDMVDGYGADRFIASLYEICQMEILV